jgi:hypothetical protein
VRSIANVVWVEKEGKVPPGVEVEAPGRAAGLRNVAVGLGDSSWRPSFDGRCSIDVTHKRCRDETTFPLKLQMSRFRSACLDFIQDGSVENAEITLANSSLAPCISIKSRLYCSPRP